MGIGAVNIQRGVRGPIARQIQSAAADGQIPVGIDTVPTGNYGQSAAVDGEEDLRICAFSGSASGGIEPIIIGRNGECSVPDRDRATFDSFIAYWNGIGAVQNGNCGIGMNGVIAAAERKFAGSNGQISAGMKCIVRSVYGKAAVQYDQGAVAFEPLLADGVGSFTVFRRGGVGLRRLRVCLRGRIRRGFFQTGGSFTTVAA